MEDFETYMTRKLTEEFSVEAYMQFLDGFYRDGLDLGRCFIQFPEQSKMPAKPKGETIANLRFLGGNSINLTLGEKSSVLKQSSHAIVFDIMTPIDSSMRQANIIEDELDRILLNRSISESGFQIVPDWSNPKRILKTPASNDDIYRVKTVTYRFNLMYI